MEYTVNEWGDGYFRFADNMIMAHEDKTFLHILTRLAIARLSQHYLIDVNRDWNVRPVKMGIDICGDWAFLQSGTYQGFFQGLDLCRSVPMDGICLSIRFQFISARHSFHHRRSVSISFPETCKAIFIRHSVVQIVQHSVA